MSDPTPEPRLPSQRHARLLAIAATAVAVGLHFVNLAFAGGLWRDEAGGVHLATKLAPGEQWRMLGHDSFPALLPGLLRGWSAIGLGHSDFGLRVLGCLLGLGVLGVIWFNARATRVNLPLFSLTLFALNPVVIRWGDSLRAYGCGVLLIMLVFGLAWSYVREPSPRRFVLASLMGALSVQCLYQNAFLLLAICGGAALVCLRRQRAMRAGTALALGVPAALSLLPYLPLLRESQRWWVVEKTGFRPAIVGGTLWDALSSPPIVGPLIWIALFGAAVVLSFRAFEAHASRNRGLENDLPVYGALVVLAAGLTFFVFAAFSGLPTQPWYWLELLGLLAVGFDATFARLWQSPKGWVAGALAVVICVAAVFAVAPVTRRMTNTDHVAGKVRELAQPADLVLVYPWYCGVSFNRYYHGAAAWDTVPDLSDHGIHRYDLLKERLRSPQPLQSILERMKQTLLAGNSVWIVGGLPPAPPDATAPVALPPAPDGPQGWYDEPYNASWGVQLAYWLQTQAQSTEEIRLEGTTRVERYEKLTLLRARGFRGPAYARPP